MSRKSSNKFALANPTRLNPIQKANNLLQVVIETPKGCRNKLAFDPEQGIFCLKSVLPVGMAFPYDFGFLPSTRGGDGDPIDVLVLMDEPVYPGILIAARLIGVIEGEQIEPASKKGGKPKKIRNDRLIAIAQPNHMFTEVKSMGDLSKQFITEVGDFFVNYHRMEGKEFRVLGVKGVDAAMTLIRKARKDA